MRNRGFKEKEVKEPVDSYLLLLDAVPVFFYKEKSKDNLVHFVAMCAKKEKSLTNPHGCSQQANKEDSKHRTGKS